jgi:hypothetical protein
MRLDKWEGTVQEIVDECGHEQEEGSKGRILTTWRAKLENQPPLLQPFQIDGIVREVRQRLDKLSR